MKKTLLVAALSIAAIACNTAKENKTAKVIIPAVKKKINVPAALTKVLKKHGGLDAWNKAQTLSYTLDKETHIVDLHSRKTKVVGSNYALGFDGKEAWLSQKDSTAFKGNPKFYYNLFFYFYAMPFVLADDGIVYSEATPFEYEGASYPGIKISYKSEVGFSPEDNYFIYYNPETFQMEWLGYTVTYFSKKVSEKVSMIRYNDWENVNGFLLPKSINWYKKDEADGVLKPSPKVVTFTSAEVSSTSKEKGFYNNPN